MKIGPLYDLQTNRSYVALLYAWKTREDRPNAPAWWHGGYSKFIKLFPIYGVYGR